MVESCRVQIHSAPRRLLHKQGSQGNGMSNFEDTYLGSVTVNSEERVKFLNHLDRIFNDPGFHRTLNMVEGFQKGFKSLVNRLEPSV